MDNYKTRSEEINAQKNIANNINYPDKKWERCNSTPQYGVQSLSNNCDPNNRCFIKKDTLVDNQARQNANIVLGFSEQNESFNNTNHSEESPINDTLNDDQESNFNSKIQNQTAIKILQTTTQECNIKYISPDQ